MNKDEEIIYVSLNMRKNLMTTGNASISLDDIQKMSKDALEVCDATIKPLDGNQMNLVLRIEKLMAACLDNKLIIKG